MYPFFSREEIKVSNLHIHDLYLRNIWQHTGTREDLNISQPVVKSLSLRNVYQRWVQYPEKLALKIIRVTALSLKNLFNRYIPQPEAFIMNVPVFKGMYLRNILQNLRTHPLDEVMKVDLPVINTLFIKDVVDSYTESEVGLLYIDPVVFTNASLRNVLNKHTQLPEELNIAVPTDIQFSGTNKPYVKHPALSADINLGTLFSVPLEWSDESVTHTGYALYRDTQPIEDDTTLPVFKTFGRDSDEYEDWDVEEDTTYYYRITPLSYVGRFLSNLVEIYVPIYLRAPHSFLSSFVSRSEPVNVIAKILSTSKSLVLDTSFTTLTELRNAYGSFLNVIHTSIPTYIQNPVNRIFNVSGSGFRDYGLRKESALHSSLSIQRIDHIEYSSDFYLGNEAFKANLVKEATNIDNSFKGVTKSFIQGTFVILGSALEGIQRSYISLSGSNGIQANGHREVVLHKPSAYILNNGQLKALIGLYTDSTHIGNESYGVTLTPSTTNLEATYEGSYESRNPLYVLSKLDKLVGAVSYENSISVSGTEFKYVNLNTKASSYTYDGLTGTSKDNYYCILGSFTGNEFCSLVRHASIEAVITTSYSLGKVRKAKGFTTLEPGSVIYAGFLPPAGMPTTYDTYKIDKYVIPVFKRNYVVPGDDVKFTLYEKVYKSKEVTSGYVPPEGTAIRFSLFVDED